MRRSLSRHWLVISAAACLLMSAAPSFAARVTQVRVGNHPTFTRVVFQLDVPAGYRIEKGVDQGVKELVVTLEAASTPRSVRSGSPEVNLVSVQDGTTSTVAHIRLRRDNAGVKELILSNPRRIVIDVMREPSLIASEKAAAAKKAAAKAAARAATKPAQTPEASKPEAIATTDARAADAKKLAEAKADLEKVKAADAKAT